METSTGRVPEAKKMRVSFLVLAGVIAICNTSASAKAVAPAAEDEESDVDQSRAEQDPQIDTAYGASVQRSSARDGEHDPGRRYISPDSGKRRSVIKKKSDKKSKTESKKFQSKKFEEHKSKSVSNKSSSRRTEKRENRDKNRRMDGLVNGDWFATMYKPKNSHYPWVTGGDSRKFHEPWTVQANFAANWVGGNHPPKVLPPEELMKVEELSKIIHSSMKGGLESLFKILDAELRKKLGRSVRPPARSANTRSACDDDDDDAGTGISCGPGIHDAMATNDCGGGRDLESAWAQGYAWKDAGKRSGGSPLEYLTETLPAVVQAAHTILTDAADKARPTGGIVGDYGMFGKRSSESGEGDGAEETAPVDGTYDENKLPWDYDV